jgi:excisionase family DNA binding protein
LCLEDERLETKANGGEKMTIVTAKELSRFFKVTESTIYNLAVNGALPGFKIGCSWRFDMDEVREIIWGQNKNSNSE